MTYEKGSPILATDYNTFQGTVNGVYAVGTGDKGYGQTAISLATVLGGGVQQVNSAEWTDLRNVIETCADHQGTSKTLLPPLAQLATGSTVVAHDKDPPSNNAYDFPDIITNIETNRFQFDTGTTTLFFDVLTSTRATTWNTKVQHIFDVTFANGNDARYFFNSGGQIVMRASLTGGTNTQSTDWATILNNAGSIIFDYTETVSSNALGTGSAIGYYDLTLTDQQIYTITSSGAYISNDYTISAKATNGPNVSGNNDNGSILRFTVDFNDDYAGSLDEVNGTLESTVDYRRATNPLTIAVPSFGTITALTAGS